MTKDYHIPRIGTGVPNLDEIFGGGLIKGSVTALSGPPGSGKTILAQQICFHNAMPDRRVLYLSTLSEPPAKTLQFMKPFAFFDAKKLRHDIQFVDLGAVLREKGLKAAASSITAHLKRVSPSFVVVDSFKVFDDLAGSSADLRTFNYEIAVNLMAWETTALVLGEYRPVDYETNPVFSIVDGLVVLSQRESLGEQQRFLRTVKMRGTDHNRDEHAFVITESGLQVFAPRLALQRTRRWVSEPNRCRTHIPKLDELITSGIPWGSSLLVSGVAGTGKTVLSLEFIYRGALAGEKGIIFAFEETEERLLATARGMGWDLEKEIARGMVEIVFIPQPEIMIEAHLLMMRERVEAMNARRVVIDSVSVFLHKVPEPQLVREKIFHIHTIIENAGAVAFLPTDIPYGTDRVSRFGVEETVVNGIIILSAIEEGEDRQRYLEVYKLRNTVHLKGRHNMIIAKGGISIFPRYGPAAAPDATAAPALSTVRKKSGVPGLDALMGGGLLERSVTIVSGSAGIGKSLLATQFLLQGTRARERGLYVSLEEGPAQLVASARAIGLPLKAAVESGHIEILYVARENLRAGQFLSVLADKLRALKAKRVVLDGATEMMAGHALTDEFPQMLYNLVSRFKILGVTSLLTLEAQSLLANDTVTGRAFSPVADNLLMLRYRDVNGGLIPTLTVVKARGSTHDRLTHAVVIAKGGMSIGPPVREVPEPTPAATARPKKTSPRSSRSR